MEDDISEKKDLSSDPNFATIIDEMLLELKAVGPCPDDVQGSFELYNKATGWSSYVRCGYFKKKPWKCHEYIDGELKCASVCARRHIKTCKPEDYA